MKDDLEKFLSRLREDRTIFMSGEEAVRQGVVLPILARLGWDRDNIREVIPEYSIGNGRVDYCLKLDNRIAAFLEVKRAGEPLDKHQEQLLGYAFREGVKLAILTDGILWWFYLPLSQGSWEQRRFIAIDIQQQDIQTATGHFCDFLERDALLNNEAIRRAEIVHASREKGRIIKNTIPRAWLALCEEPDELLIELLADKVESLCGHRPDPEALMDFLHEGKPSAIQQTSVMKPMPRIETSGPKGRSAIQPGRYTFKKPVAYTFLGKRRTIHTFKDILLGITATLYECHTRDFPRAFELRGRKRSYFARSPDSMTTPIEVDNTGIYVETCLSANAVVDRCYDLIMLFGYLKNDLKIECENPHI